MTSAASLRASGFDTDMTLEQPNLIERVLKWPYLKLTLTGVGLLAVIGGTLFVIDRCGSYRDRRDIDIKKEAIVNKAQEIANIQTTIANLSEQKAEKQGELKRDVEQLQKDVYGREDTKAETNAALANFNRAVNSNSNANVTAEDLKRILERLNQ